MKIRMPLRRFSGRRGATVVFVAVAMVALLSFAALAVDLGYLYVVKNELQNAADAGALAGAQVLYNDEGTAVNPGADAVARQFVENNQSERVAATVESIERGHWSFTTRTFTPNESLDPVDLWDVTTAELDANTDFINAVRVVTRRKEEGGELPQHFFARIFGAAPSNVRAVAVGYIGFAGTLTPLSVDQPIALCKDKITVGGTYSCNVGRMLNNTEQTARWTNFEQPESGTCTATDREVGDLVCQSGNIDTLFFGDPFATTNGTHGNNVDAIEECWRASAGDSDGDGNPDQPWPLTLPVVNGPCGGGECGNFNLVGAVTVNVLWVIKNNDPLFARVPRKMLNPNTGELWECSTTLTSPVAGQQCWNEFAEEFHLKNALDLPVTIDDYALKSIYFLPDCTAHEPTGLTGGENFGILAKVPVLVR